MKWMRKLAGVFPALVLSCIVPAAAQTAAPPPASTPHVPLAQPQRAGTVAIGAPYAAFVKPMERQSGLIDILRRDNELYFDLGPAQMDADFLIEPVLSSGVGSGAFAGRMFEAHLVRFHRRGNTVYWETRNTDFSAGPDTTAAAIATSTGDSVFASSPVLAEDAQTGHVVIAPAILLSDLEGVGAELGRHTSQPVPGPIPGLLMRMPSAFSLDAGRTYVTKSKALPANDEITVNLGFSGAPNTLQTVPDARGFSMTMHYSIVALPPSKDYVPRLADDRIGYQLTTHARLGDTSAPSSIVRYINRWNLSKGPVVFYLSDSIPVQYRAPVRSALLSWNGVFARAGWPHAVEVREQPKDPSWDPDDARYSVVRWISSFQPDFAGYTGVISNPVTGEILRASVVIDGEDVRGVRGAYRDFGLALRAGASLGCESGACAFPTESAYAAEYADQASFARTALGVRGAPVDGEAFARDWVRSVVLHESGHAFGLRHNFAASTYFTLAQIHDARFTAAHGLSASVMDYLPVNVSASGRARGRYFQQTFGPYDYWAIKYGYARIPGIRYPAAETLFLRPIARESTLPGHAFGSDEDASGAGWVDPQVSPFDLSSDPIGFERDQFELAQQTLRRLARSGGSQDQSFYRDRLAFETVLRTKARSAFLASRFIGGLYTSHAHAGQGQTPFRPVPRATAKRAFDLLSRYIFSEEAFALPAGYARRLGNEGFYDMSPPTTRPDFPLAMTAGAVQAGVLARLFDPSGLARIFDGEVQAAHAPQEMRLEDIFEWTRTSIFAELGQSGNVRVAPLRRELQRRLTDQFLIYAEVPSQLLNAAGAPRETQALARYELAQIDAAIARKLHAAGDVGTSAHLQEEHARIGRALRAINVQPL